MGVVTAFVSVGVFVALTGGAPSVEVLVADAPFSTMEACDAHVALVRERIASPQAGVVLLAVGLKCVEVAVESVPVKKAGTGPREFTEQEKAGGKIDGKSFL